MVVRPSKGGAFGHALRLSRELEKQGYECAICGPHAEVLDSTGPTLFHVDIPRRPHPAHHPLAIARLARVYRDYRPHVVHAHGSQGGVIARLARFAHPTVPVIFTPHNYAFMNYFANPLERATYRAIEMALAPLASRVVCVCRAEQEVAARIGPAGRTRVVYNGIEPLEPAPADPGVESLQSSGPLVCTVAELQVPKGVTTLIDAMATISQRFPSANLVVAGDGVERERLERQIADLGLSERVHLFGSVDNVAGLLGAADVFVQPGWSESFPYSILEAMGMGLPIVATDVGGVGEAIEDGVTGRLVKPKDAVALGEAAIELIGDRDRAAALGRNARERMMSRFRLDRMVSDTLAVYREVGLP